MDPLVTSPTWQPAPLSKRAGAFLIDTFFTFLIVLPLNIKNNFFQMTTQSDIVVIPWLDYITGPFLTTLYFVGFLAWKSATPGKLILKLKVAPKDNLDGKLSLESAILRTIVSHISTIFVIYLPQALAFFRTDNKQLADLFADTQVVFKPDEPIHTKSHKIVGTIILLFSLSGAAVSTHYWLTKVKYSSQGIELPTMPHTPNKK